MGEIPADVSVRIKAGIRYTIADIWQEYEIRLSEWDLVLPDAI